MNRDIFIKNLTGDKIEMSPKGRCANELSVEEFEKGYEKFFEMIFEVADTRATGTTGRRCLRRRFSRRTISTKSTRRSCNMLPTAKGRDSLQITIPFLST